MLGRLQPYTMAAPPDLLARQWDLFGLNTVLGFPSHLLQVVPAIGPGKVERLFYAGEHLYEDDRRVLRDRPSPLAPHRKAAEGRGQGVNPGADSSGG